ncbi:MAG: hypothetical protein JXR76_04845 [Deltaproteobacteria bacterium]|nr:hypothetical protein [Deltaproteobacteria bacterium]
MHNTKNIPQMQNFYLSKDGDIRIIELTNHPFFILVLFVPQTNSTSSSHYPLIVGFVNAVCDKPVTQ